MFLLSAKPLYKLTGTDRQAGRRTDRPRFREACTSKNEVEVHWSNQMKSRDTVGTLAKSHADLDPHHKNS